MSDGSDDEFSNSKANLSKDQHLYGIFTQAYERPSLGKHHKHKNHTPKTNQGFISFKAGEKIETYSDKVEVSHLTLPKKKKKTVTFSDNPLKDIIQNSDKTEEHTGQQIFTLESLMNTLNKNQQQMQQQVQQEEEPEQILPGFTERTKSILKLKKYAQEQEAQLIDHGSVTEFGKKGRNISKLGKSNDQLQKQRQFSQKYGVGYKILSRLGFNASKGLGKNQDGMLQPVASVNKQTLDAEDDIQPFVVDEEDNEAADQKSEQKQDINILELFQYFSQDPAINSIIQHLKSQHQTLQLAVADEKQLISRISAEIEVAESQKIQYQSKLQQQLKKLQQLTGLKNNIDGYPHLALKYNIDLIIVKNTIQKIKINNPQDLVGCKSMFRQIKSASRKLEQIYLEKQREIVHQFTQSGLKHFTNINNVGSSDVISITQEDQNKIKKYEKIIFQSSMLPAFQRLLNNLSLIDDLNVNICIEVFDGLGKIDKPTQQKLLDQHVYPLLQDYLKTFKITNILPHLVVFPWFTVINLTKINFKDFIFNTLSLEWTPEDSLMCSLISPWKKYIDKKNWNNLISFGIAPRLFDLVFDFQISASSQNIKNLNKLKSLIRYCELLTVEHVQAILQQSILPAIHSTYRSLQHTETPEKIQKWSENWENTLGKIKPELDLCPFFDKLSSQ